MKVKNYSAKNKRRDGKGSDVSQFGFDKRFLLSPARAYYRHTNREVIAEERDHLRSLTDLRHIDGYFDCADEYEAERLVEEAFEVEGFGAEYVLIAHGMAHREAMDRVWDVRNAKIDRQMAASDRRYDIRMVEMAQDAEESLATIDRLMREPRAVAA